MTLRNSIVSPITSQYANESLRIEESVIRPIISPRRITTLLACAAAFLILAGIASKYASFRLGAEGMHQYHILGIAEQFDLDIENNISSYYQVATLMFCSLLLMLISWAKRGNRDRYYQRWRLLAFIFLLMSLDESASLHESTIEPLQKVFRLGDFFHFAWVVPAIIFVIVVAISYLPFLLSLPAGTRRMFVLAGATYVGGAVGIEIISGRLLKLYGERSPQYAAGTVVEETLEIIGVWIFIYALLSYLSKQVKVVCVEFEGKNYSSQENVFSHE